MGCIIIGLGQGCKTASHGSSHVKMEAYVGNKNHSEHKTDGVSESKSDRMRSAPQYVCQRLSVASASDLSTSSSDFHQSYVHGYASSFIHFFHSCKSKLLVTSFPRPEFVVWVRVLQRLQPVKLLHES